MDVLDSIRRKLATLPTELQKAAKWVLENASQAGQDSLRKIAKASDTSPNSVSRMARAVGYQDFASFQTALREDVVLTTRSFTDRASWLQSISANDAKPDRLFAQMAHDSLGNLEHLFQTLDPTSVRQAASLIRAARRTEVLGVGMAHPMAQNFAYIASMALPDIRSIPSAGELPSEAVANLSNHDVLIAMTFRPYRREVVEAVKIAVEHGVKVIAISDSLASPILDGATHEFMVKTETPQFFTSTIALAALLETLVAFLIAEAPAQAVRNIDDIHRRRQALGLYWERD